MKPKLLRGARNLAPRVSGGVTAALWLFVGVRMVRTLIGLPKMVPTRAPEESLSPQRCEATAPTRRLALGPLDPTATPAEKSALRVAMSGFSPGEDRP
jgi:hypothetical protein